MTVSANFTRLCLGLAVSAMMVSACATSSSTLLTGIDRDLAVSSTSTGTPVTRTASDPVCEQFYRNAVTYSQEARKPNAGGQILASTGLGVLATLATGGLLGGLGSGVGGLAVRQATSQLIFNGGGAALSGLNSADKIDARIIEAANDLGCPVQTT